MRSPKKFLVIDDNDEFSALIARFLRKEWNDSKVDCYNPETRGRPPVDFDWASYDVILLDYQLGSDDGLRWLRRYGHSPGFPLTIMLTAEGSEDIAVKAFKLGAKDYIPKRQINSAVLISAVREAWSEKDPPKAAPAGPFTVSGYRVLEKIGEGATAAVYRAERVSDGLPMVIKTLRTEGSGVDTYVERFLQEYELIDRVRHPNVVRIYDRGVTSDSLYIAMEYFAGGDLRQRLRKVGGFPAAAALEYGRQIAEGLAAIHAVGVIHRDLKTSNVMIRADNSVAIIDFGIAKQIEVELGYTQAGTVLGTPGYSSPENITGKGLDGRSDLYSLGVILFEMFTGQRPFSGLNTPALVYKQLHSPVPRLPEPFDRYQILIDRTMALEPSERYASAKHLVTALKKFADLLEGGAAAAGVPS